MRVDFSSTSECILFKVIQMPFDYQIGQQMSSKIPLCNLQQSICETVAKVTNSRI
jgi:hypothetical protein